MVSLLPLVIHFSPQVADAGRQVSFHFPIYCFLPQVADAGLQVNNSGHILHLLPLSKDHAFPWRLAPMFSSSLLAMVGVPIPVVGNRMVTGDFGVEHLISFSLSLVSLHRQGLLLPLGEQLCVSRPPNDSAASLCLL